VRLRSLLPPLLLSPLLAGCQAVVLDPAGHVAEQQRDLLVLSVVLMLIIIIPVMALTVWFAWKYRASNKDARYEPDWDHSTHLELVIWAVPLLIIICLGAVTWAGTHLLDPYRPLDRISKDRAVAADVRPLQVNVVALDWKWLFIYPEYGIATVNEIAVPVDRPVRFSLTSSSVMNAFYVPAMAGMIYAMPGMETKLHGVINAPGEYKGFSANYSGDGFSDMRFAFRGLRDDQFNAWVAEARAGGRTLDRVAYLELARPSEKTPVMRFAGVQPHLWDQIVNMCVQPGKMCMGEMMAIDDRGGLGLGALENTWPLAHDDYRRRTEAVLGGAGRGYVLAICTADDAEAAAEGRAALELASLNAPAPSLARVQGLGLSRPTTVPHVRPSVLPGRSLIEQAARTAPVSPAPRGARS
jgi:cytochrome o ubiquinol oxidase subunit 2